MSETILIFGLIFFLGHFFTLLFKKTWIPDVLLLMVLGIVLGSVLHLVSPVDFGKVGSVLTTITLIIILFECGTTLKIDSVMKSIRSTFGLTLTSFVVTVGITVAIGIYWFHMEPMAAILFGVAIGGTSSAVVIPMVSELHLRKKVSTLLMIESALSDVLCIVVFFAIMEGATSGHIVPVSMLASMIMSLLVATAIGLLGGVVWLLFLQSIRSFPNTIMACFAFSFVLYGITELLDFSGPIAVLCFGITLANHKELNLSRLPGFRKLADPDFVGINETERVVFGEVVFYFKTVFFIYLGISIEFRQGPEVIYAAILVPILYVCRILVTRVAIRGDFTLKEASLISIMIPKGLAAAVLAAIPVHAGMKSGEVIQEITYMTVLYSITLTALLVPLVMKDKLAFFYRLIFHHYPKESAPADTKMT